MRTLSRSGGIDAMPPMPVVDEAAPEHLRVYRKLGIRSRSELVRPMATRREGSKALRQGDDRIDELVDDRFVHAQHRHSLSLVRRHRATVDVDVVSLGFVVSVPARQRTVRSERIRSARVVPVRALETEGVSAGHGNFSAVTCASSSRVGRE